MYVILISESPFAPECLSTAATSNKIPFSSDADRVFHFDMDSSTRRMRIEAAGSLLTDWEDEPEKLARLKALEPPGHFYIAHYKDIERLRNVLYSLASCTSFLIDDDYDLFVTSDEFVALCDANPEHNHWWLSWQED